jgi:hypothetical protein
MTRPLNAKAFVAQADPADVLDWQITLSQGSTGLETLQPGESVASFTVALTAEAIAAGLQINTTSGYATLLVGNVITFWLSVTSGVQASTVFSGAGLAVGVEITITTNANPARVKQRTVVVTVAQQ